MDIKFLNRHYNLVLTEHARQRMKLRTVDMATVVEILETGTIVRKSESAKFWVYKSFSSRKDNTICLSVSVEDPNLIVITALVNWRPQA